MSHYKVAVFQMEGSPDIDELMAPYSEHIEVEPYVSVPHDEAIHRAREVVERATEKMEAGTGDEYATECVAHAGDGDEELLQWYAKEWYGRGPDEDGNILTTYNPDSKWDYYGEECSCTFDEWLESGSDGHTEEDLRREWETLSTEGDGIRGGRYYTERYGDADTFVKACMLPACWAVLTPDGEWHEPGQVGWFGTDDSTPERWQEWIRRFDERFVEPYAGKGVTVAIVDCHI